MLSPKINMVNLWAESKLGLKQKIKKACIFRLEIESDRDKISLDCFPSLRTINMYPLLFMEGSVITSRKQRLSAHRHP